jgi:Arc/MetJ family transcription regulator
MSIRVMLLEWLIEKLQHLITDHRTTHRLHADTVRRYQQFFSLKETRAYYHALFRRPKIEGEQVSEVRA